MGTKEQIAKKYVQCRCDEIYTSRGLTAPDCPYHSSDVESAMDEWGKIISIRFLKYFIKNHWLSDDKYTDDQFYELFLQSIQQP